MKIGDTMKKGFTLIEVIGVVVLLGAIALIAYPTITKVMNDTKGKIDSATTQIITSSADLYLEQKNCTISERTCCIVINNIVQEGLLKTPLKDSKGNDIDLTKGVKVAITRTNGIYKKNFTIENNCTGYSSCLPNN